MYPIRAFYLLLLLSLVACSDEQAVSGKTNINNDTVVQLNLDTGEQADAETMSAEQKTAVGRSSISKILAAASRPDSSEKSPRSKGKKIQAWELNSKLEFLNSFKWLP